MFGDYMYPIHDPLLSDSSHSISKHEEEKSVYYSDMESFSDEEASFHSLEVKSEARSSVEIESDIQKVSKSLLAAKSHLVVEGDEAESGEGPREILPARVEPLVIPRDGVEDREPDQIVDAAHVDQVVHPRIIEAGEALVLETESELKSKAAQKITDLIAAEGTILSTQALLGKILGSPEIKKLREDKGFVVEIEAKIKGDPQFEVEPFTTPSDPDKTYYKTDVSYKIKLFKNGLKVDDWAGAKIDREIYTTSTNPSEAILAANDFKNTIVNLAKINSGDTTVQSLTLKDEIKDDVMKQKSFKFQYSYHNGKISSLKEIHFGEKNLYNKEAIKDHMFYRGLGTQRLETIKKDEQRGYTGYEIYASETEALLSAPFKIIQDAKADYTRMLGSSNIEQQIQDIKDQLVKKEAEISELKKNFVNDSWTSALRSDKFQEDFKQIEKKIADDTVAVTDYENVKRFNNSLSELRRANEFLKYEKNHLENLAKTSNEEKVKTTVTAEAKDKAQLIANSISNKEITDLQRKIEENEKLIETLSKKLNPRLLI